MIDENHIASQNLIKSPTTFNDLLYNELTRREWDLSEEEVDDLIEAYEKCRRMNHDVA